MLERKEEMSTQDQKVTEINAMLECETHFGKDFFWNELETIVEDGLNLSNDAD